MHVRVLGAATSTALLIVWMPVAVSAQAPAWLKPAGHVGVQVSIEPPATGRAGGLVLIVEVTPSSGIHVYAPGNKDYIPVEVVMDAAHGVTAGAAVYPPSEPFVFGDLRQTVQVYQKPFRIRQPLSIDPAARARPLTVTGTLRYQACTDSVCYRPESQPLSILVPARAASKTPRK